jgi:CheY-like chemotaxis protein
LEKVQFLFLRFRPNAVPGGGGNLAADANLSNVRVLAIDDDPDVLTYFRNNAQGFGVLCDTATSGEKALALVDKNGPYHIYFVDWKMPVMDGIQLARELKARKFADSNSIALMTSAAELGSIMEEAKRAGVNKFLSKPLFPFNIAEIINECMNTDKGKTELADITGIFAGRRVLLVEDVEINRDIVQALLEPTQLKIDCAENGVEAVRMFAEAPEKYDFIFMDIQMPEMDGYEATRRIRALDFKAAKTVPIVAMTANVFREDIERCFQSGMDNHIGKPLDFENVLNKLRFYLDKKEIMRGETS